MSKPEWVELAPGVQWCKGCGCVKLHMDGGKPARYKVPRRETERRKAKKYDNREPDFSKICLCNQHMAPRCQVHYCMTCKVKLSGGLCECPKKKKLTMKQNADAFIEKQKEAFRRGHRS